MFAYDMFGLITNNYKMFQKGFVFSKDTWPKWAYTDIWAPEMHKISDKYYVYFSARKRTGRLLNTVIIVGGLSVHVSS